MLTPIFIWENKVLKRIDPAEVVCLNIEKNYTRIFLSDRSYFLVRSSLVSVLKKFPPEMFVRTHRSFAVSIYYIDNIAKDHLTVTGEAIPVARQYYSSVIKQLNIIE